MPVTARPLTIVADQDAYRNTDHRMRLKTHSGSVVSGNITVDPTLQYSRLLMDGNSANTTVTFSAPNKIYSSITSPTSSYNLPGLSGDTGNIWYVEVRNRGTNTVTFNNVTWDNASVPTIVSSGSTLLGFYSPNGGTTIYGWAVSANWA